jgi:hypothetical protein
VNKAEAATYYVDSSVTDTNLASATADFTTYNPTTFATSTGSDSVYNSVLDISAGSFSPGDNILFRKGQTWYGTLTVPSSGTVEQPITFGAFGSGDKPVINGADNLNYTSAWTKYPGNLFLNPSFEIYSSSQLVNGWNGSSGVIFDTVTVKTGNKSIRFDVNAANTDIFYGQTTATVIQAGTEHTLSFWYNVPVGKTARWVFKNNTTGHWMDSTGAWFTSAKNNVVSGTGEWTQYSITFTTEVDSGPFAVRLTLEREASASSSLYFDDVFLVPTTPPTDTIWGYRMGATSGQRMLRVFFNGTEGNPVGEYDLLASDLDSILTS